MGDYQRSLENPGSWAKLGWPLDRVAFVKRLDELRGVRNDVMHFNPDPVPPDSVDKLRNILSMLRQYCDELAFRKIAVRLDLLLVDSQCLARDAPHMGCHTHSMPHIACQVQPDVVVSAAGCRIDEHLGSGQRRPQVNQSYRTVLRLPQR